MSITGSAAQSLWFHSKLGVEYVFGYRWTAMPIFDALLIQASSSFCLVTSRALLTWQTAMPGQRASRVWCW